MKIILFVAGLMLGSILVQSMHASGTNIWELVHRENPWLNGRVMVIDTTGVCIYLAVVPMSIAMTAVPKTQLPVGTGCQ